MSYRTEVARDLKESFAAFEKLAQSLGHESDERKTLPPSFSLKVLTVFDNNSDGDSNWTR